MGLEDLLAGGPPAPAPKATKKKAARSPLGVPAGEFNLAHTVAEGLGGASNQQGAPLPPRYYEGDEHRPASYPTESVANIQRALASAGLYGDRTRFRLGVWDEPTVTAYRKLLEYANRSGVDEAVALQQYAAGMEVDPDDPNSPAGSGGAKRAPLTVRQTNPADLREMAETLIAAKTGRRDSALADRMVNAYLSEERRAQVDGYNTVEGGGTVVDAPSADVFMDDTIERERPDLVFARQEFGAAQEALSMLDQLASGGERYGV